MGFAMNPWNLLLSMRSIDLWQKTVNNNLNGSLKTGYKGADIQFGGGATTYMRPPSQTKSAIGIGEQSLPVAHTTIDFKQGTLVKADADTQFAIQGEGFFLVQKLDFF